MSDELSSLIADKITHYKEANKSRSFESIAREARKFCPDVNRNFIFRLQKKSVNAASHPDRIFAVSSVVGDKDFIESVEKKVAAALSRDVYMNHRGLGDRAKEINGAISAEFEEMLVAAPGRLRIYQCCCMDSGATLEEVKAIPLIDSPELILKEMIALKMIFEQDGRYYSFQEDYTMSFEAGVKILQEFTKLYNYKNVGKNRNFLTYEGANVSDDGVLELFEEEKRHQNAIRKIISKNPGNRKMFLLAMMDSLHSKVFDDISNREEL